MMDKWWIWPAVAFAVACGPAEPSGKAPKPKQAREVKPSSQDLCQALCERSAACGESGPGCVASCVERMGQQAEHQRGAYLWSLVSCLEAIDCSVIAQDQAEQACGDAARSRLQATKTLRKFCFDSTRRANACGKRTDQSQCLDEFRVLDEPSLKQGQECLSEPCDQVPRCFERAFGF